MQTGKAIAPSCRLDPWIGFLIWIVLVAGLQFLPAPVAAASGFPGSAGVPKPPVDQASFEAYLSAIGRPVVSRYHGYRASFSTWQRDQLLVYGTPATVPNNRYDSRYREYAYLGYSFDETMVSNSLFPDDSASGETYSSPWVWQELPLGLAAELSWARLTPRQKQLVSQAALKYRQRTYGGMTFQGLGLSGLTSQVLTLPAWHLGFALYTQHYLPGTSSVRYATLTGEGGGDVSVQCEIDVLTGLDANDTLVFQPGEDTVELEYQLRGWISGTSGLAHLSDVAYCGVGNGQGAVQGSGSGPWTIQLSRTIHRGELDEALSKPLTLHGQAWAVSWMGDIRMVEVQRTIQLSAQPSQDLTVDFSVEGSLDYFANRTGSHDYLAIRDRNRYLGLEVLTFDARFSRPPEEASLSFLGESYELDADGVRQSFQVTVPLPVDQSTLDWQHRRLHPAHWAQLKATAKREAKPDSQPEDGGPGDVETDNGEEEDLVLEASIHGIEITGDIHDLSRVLSG